MPDDVNFMMASTEAQPTGKLRTIPELASNPMSDDEYAIGQRIHDSLPRTLEIMGETVSLDSAYVHYKNGILTVDLLTNPRTRRRMILGTDDRATFMDYNLDTIYGRKIIIAPHFAANAVERNLESVLQQTKSFAVDAQREVCVPS